MRQQYFTDFNLETESSERLLKVGSIFQLNEEIAFLKRQVGKLRSEMYHSGDDFLAYEIAENKRNLRKLEARMKEMGGELCLMK